MRAEPRRLREVPAASPAQFRCGIYTRKSTDEGLEQDFNSLDAQREAAELFISSQRQEGWMTLPRHYDDGGAYAQARGFCGDVGRQLRRTRQITVRRKVMLAQPHVAVAQSFGGLRLLDAARVNLL